MKITLTINGDLYKNVSVEILDGGHCVECRFIGGNGSESFRSMRTTNKNQAKKLIDQDLSEIKRVVRLVIENYNKTAK